MNQKGIMNLTGTEVIAKCIEKFNLNCVNVQEIENQIKEKGLEEKYVNALFNVVGFSFPKHEFAYQSWFAVIHSNVQQKCRAALLALHNE